MFTNFSEEARNLIVVSKEEMTKLKHPYVGSEHFLLAVLKTKNEIKEKLNKIGITYDKVLNEIIKIIGVGTCESTLFLYTPVYRRIIENARLDSKDINKDVQITMSYFSILNLFILPPPYLLYYINLI